MKEIILIITILVLISCSCGSSTADQNRYKLGKKLVVGKDTLVVTDITPWYLHLNNGKKVDVDYPIIDDSIHRNSYEAQH